MKSSRINLLTTNFNAATETKMKTARKVAIVYELICPHCEESIPHNLTGAFMWPTHEDRPQQAKCTNCGETVKVPKF